MGGDARRGARRSSPTTCPRTRSPWTTRTSRGSRARWAITCPRARAPAGGGRRRSRRRTTIGRPRSTGWPSIAWRPPGSVATRSPTGRGPATRAATTSPTGSAARTRRSVRAPTPSTGPSGAGTRRASTPGWRPSCRPQGSRSCLRVGRTRSTPRARRAEATILALRLDTGLALDDAEAGPLAPHLGWALDAGLLERYRGPRAPGPPHDPRPIALERAVQPARVAAGAKSR